jgi:acyl carrier protein
MIDPEIRKFAFSSFDEMNYESADFDDDTILGPAGADLDSVALAELAVRFEDRFGIKFTDDEAEQLAAVTIGEFCDAVAARLPAVPAHSQ